MKIAEDDFLTNSNLYARASKVNDDSNQVIVQSLEDHLQNVAKLAQNMCDVPELRETIYQIGSMHDLGKETKEWQKYLRLSFLKDWQGTKVDHSTLGGLKINQNLNEYKESLDREILELVIFSHHGMKDALSEMGESIFEKRINEKNNKKYADYLIDDKNKFHSIKLYDYLCKGVSKNNRENAYYSGALYRYLLSLLVDADWTDASYASESRTQEEVDYKSFDFQSYWSDRIEQFEQYISLFESRNELDELRSRISLQCKEFSNTSNNMIRLQSFTGSGKTLSALRFALYKARNEKKRHIFLIAPYQSILDQTYKIYCDIFGEDEVLLHHSRVTFESEELDKKYEYLIENYQNSPIVLTTMVQLLNSIFRSSLSDVRRFHALANSVLIFDEVQSIPPNLMGLFNWAMNFCTKYLNTTVVLCSATHPKFDEMDDYLLDHNAGWDMVPQTDPFIYKKQRYRIVWDCWNQRLIPFSIKETANLIEKRLKAYDFKNMLIVLNTKKAARDLFETIKAKNLGYSMYYLSTDLYPSHRGRIIQELKEKLQTDQRIICVSTQLIEAGVDLSFVSVMRSFAGMDNILQVAGRCNRNDEIDCGLVQIVKISDKEENISNLKYIKDQQDIMISVLSECDDQKNQTELLDHYYKQYNWKFKDDLKCPNGDDSYQSLTELLSTNCRAVSNIKSKNMHIMNQAFKQAGNIFQVIDDKNTIPLVVECESSEDLINQYSKTYLYRDKKKIIRRMQSFIVTVSKYTFKKLDEQGLVYPLDRENENGIWVLNKNGYDESLGVCIFNELPFICI